VACEATVPLRFSALFLRADAKCVPVLTAAPAALVSCIVVSVFHFRFSVFVVLAFVFCGCSVSLAMSVFFEYSTDLQSRSKGPILATAFSNGEQHILAVATKNGDISMYLEEVSEMCSRYLRRRNVSNGSNQRVSRRAVLLCCLSFLG
jgi:hypothetical protein